MDIQGLLSQVMQDPRAQEVISTIADEMVKDGVPADALQQIAGILQQVLDNPQSWSEVRQYLIENDALDEGDVPEEFNQGFVICMLAAIMEVLKRTQSQGQAQGQTQGFARGGLARYTLEEARDHLQERGRNGDTILAHINPHEASALRRMGGSGTINPHTGLHEFGFLKKAFKAVKKYAAPLAVLATNFIAPGLGAAIGGTMGLSGMAASAAGGAILGGAASGLTGGNILKGAALGGLGGAASSALGGAGSAAEGASSGASGAAGGASAAGGAGDAFRGLSGAGMSSGASSLGSGLSNVGDVANTLGGSVPSMPLGSGFYDTIESATGELAGAAPSMPLGSGFYDTAKNIGSGVLSLSGNTQEPQASYYPEGDAYMPAGEKIPEPSALQRINGVLQSTGDFLGSPGGKLVGSLGGAAISAYDANRKNQLIKEAMANQQRELAARKAESDKYSRPVRYAFERQTTSPLSRMGASEFFTNNALPTVSQAYADGGLAQAFAEGGCMYSADGGYMRGGSGGQADDVNAMLSDGEFVIPADVVAHLGDGNNEAGARKLYSFMNEVRRQKTAKRSGLPSKAKAPAQYFKRSK